MQKGVDALVSGGWSEDSAYRWGTVLLFAGMLVTALLNCVVHVVSAYAGVNEAVDATALNEVSNTSPRNSTESKKGTRASTAKAPVDVEAPSPPPTDSSSEVSEDGCCICKPGEHEIPVRLCFLTSYCCCICTTRGNDWSKIRPLPRNILSVLYVQY
jgi:hypothetical protein